MQWNPDRYRQRLTEIKNNHLLVFDYVSELTGDHITGDLPVFSLEDIYETLCQKLIAQDGNNLSIETVKSWGRHGKNGPRNRLYVTDLEKLLNVPKYYFYDFNDEESKQMAKYCAEIDLFKNIKCGIDKKQVYIPFEIYDVFDKYFEDIYLYSKEDIANYTSYVSARFDKLYNDIKNVKPKRIDLTFGDDHYCQKLESFTQNFISLTTRAIHLHTSPKFKEIFSDDDWEKLNDDTTLASFVQLMRKKSMSYIATACWNS